ncbi:MAG: immunoglobulin-like domain-containing protein, partial [Flammeovirgaceae bacterium]
MKQLIRYTSIVAIFILSIFMYGCEDEELVIEVFAGFTHTTDTETGTVTFINTSENAEGFSWDFGDGTTSTEINPAKTYVTGTYVVQLTATNDDISDVFTDTISIFVPEAISLPATFDDSNVEYIATVFNGASFEVVDNPDLSGVNNMATKVGKVTNIGAAFEGLFFDLGVPIDLSTKMSITMKFWSDTPIDILLKLEEGTTAPIETSASHGGTGWEMITFNFSSTATFSRLTLFVDAFGTATGSFYFDDISQEETGDITAPIITLNGDVMMELQVGDVFTDPGATAMDDVDGDISANIVVGGDVVDTSTEGTYTITYNVSDAAGNAATEATRTVNVGPAVLFPIDFEDGFAFSGAFDNGANGSNADNPNPSGINTSA